MSKREASGTRASLIERAADLYDFRRLFAQPAPNPLPEPGDVLRVQATDADPLPVRMQNVAPSWVPLSATPFAFAKPFAAREKDPATAN